MKLTDGERLIVVMLAEVMEALKLDAEINPTLVKKLAINNDDWAIKKEYSGIFNGEGPSDAEVSETVNILWMWGIIEHAIGGLDGEQAKEAKSWRWNEFRGFDGNNDPHYGIAHTLTADLDQFGDLKGRDLNSHSQASLPRYRAMYAKFEKHLEASAGEPLSFDALRDLCN
jgi:hypothetical protein